jgi:hypothetical protein
MLIAETELRQGDVEPGVAPEAVKEAAWLLRMKSSCDFEHHS